MTTSGPSPDVRQVLLDGCPALVDRWRRGIARTNYVPLSAGELRTQLKALLDEAIAVLVSDVDATARAHQIGSSLVHIGYTAGTALGTTLEILGSLPQGLPDDQALALQPRLTTLLAGVATGFGAAARERLLNEQEASHSAVLVENRRTGEALRRQAALLDLAPDAIIVRTLDGTIVFWNRGAEVLYGWSRDEVLGRITHEVLHTRFPSSRAESEQAVLRDGQWEGELRHSRRDGSAIIVSSRWAVQMDANGRPHALLEINTDITARKQMEAILNEREASLETAQAMAHLGSWDSDLLTNVVHWSQEARRLLGYAGDAVVPTLDAFMAAVHPADRQLVQRAVEDALNDNSYVFEFRTYGRDGVERILQSQSELARDASGQAVRIFGTLQDITERKRAEAQRGLLLAEQSARAEAEAAQERFAFLAEASTRLASSLDYEVTLRNVAELAVPLLADVCTVDILREDGEVRRVATAHVAPTPEEVIERYAVPLLARGRVLGAITCFASADRPADTSIERALAEELARRCGLAIDNARLHAEAQRATRLRDEFLSVAAHELKTPMTTLRGYAQLLGRSVYDGQVPRVDLLVRSVHAIDVQSEKLVLLTEQLLNVSRIEAGKLRLEPQPMDLVVLVANIVQSTQHSTERHTLSFAAPDVCLAEVDPMRFEQVVTNLVDNAVKYSPDGGPIEITLSTPDPRTILLAVRDWGLGIPVERRENLFDRFYQAHGEGHFGGLGLGLYVSRQIVELHGGSIEAEFPPSGGSRFVVVLPRAPALA